jgi:hypothetical protein
MRRYYDFEDCAKQQDRVHIMHPIGFSIPIDSTLEIMLYNIFISVHEGDSISFAPITGIEMMNVVPSPALLIAEM